MLVLVVELISIFCDSHIVWGSALGLHQANVLEGFNQWCNQCVSV